MDSPKEYPLSALRRVSVAGAPHHAITPRWSAMRNAPGAVPWRASLIDMRRDVSFTEIKRYVNSLGVHFLNRWFMMLLFRLMVIKRAYPADEIRNMAHQAAWIEPEVEITAVGFEAWMTK